MVRNILENLVLLFCMVLILVFIWILFVQNIVRGDPVVFDKMGSVTHKTLKTEYKPLQVVTATVSAFTSTNTIGTVQWVLDGPIIEIVAERVELLDERVNKKTIVVGTIPPHAVPGEYYFRGFIKYDFGLRNVYVPVETNKFIVVRE